MKLLAIRGTSVASLYRIVYPALMLQSRGVEVAISNNINVNLISEFDVVWLPYGCSMDYVITLGLAKMKAKHTKFIIDVDDSILDVNFGSARFRAKLDKSCFRTAIADIADGLTVSTKPLQNRLNCLNNNSVVIPVRLPRWRWPLNPIAIDKPFDRYIHFGSKTHEWCGNVPDYIKLFASATLRDYNWTAVWCKCIPCTTFVSKVCVHEFPSLLYSLNPTVGICSLDMSKHKDFNVCKSNLKMLELIACGAVPVCTDCITFEDAFCKAKCAEDWFAWFKMLKYREFRKQALIESYNKVRHSIWLEDNLFSLYRSLCSVLPC